MIITVTFSNMRYGVDTYESQNKDFCFGIWSEISDYYEEKYGANVFFRDTENKSTMSANIVEVEYNFDITDGEREELTDRLKSFFLGKDTDMRDNETHRLSSVIFKKTDAQALVFN